ncbi:MAG: cell division protein FtsA, partial [SAR202 cluster bacterium]|nr:cell division protein FtsA [SAR202 cluster bacterium]
MKANYNDHNQIMALDIGSSKVSCVVARSQIDKKIFIEGISSISYRPSDKNKSSDNQEMIEAIKESFFTANARSSTKMRSVIVGLSGTFISSTNVNLNIPRSDNIKLVTQSDIDNAVKIAKHIDLEEGKELIHVIPQSFSLDGMQGIRNPLGMHATELKASCHIIAGSKNNICNLNKSILEADIQPTNQVVGSVATARALLTAKEREEGAIMIDIGASTTDVAVFNNGSVIHTDSIPMGGDLFTSDIATAFDID